MSTFYNKNMSGQEIAKRELLKYTEWKFKKFSFL